jgi:hypothetical protein
MRVFGLSCGVAGLARLLTIEGFSAEIIAIMAFVLLVANVLYVVHEGVMAFVHRLIHHEEAPYVGWGVCTVLILSSFVGGGALSTGMWVFGLGLGVVLMVLGVRDLWMNHDVIDMAHISWFAWLLVAAVTAPKGVSAQVINALGWTGSAVSVVMVIAAFERAVRHRTFDDMRSPWFSLGALASTAIWVQYHGDPNTKAFLFPVLAVLAVIWAAPVVRAYLKKPNLFPLSNITLFSYIFHLSIIPWLLTSFCAFIALVESRTHVAHVIQLYRRKLKA